MLCSLSIFSLRCLRYKGGPALPRKMISQGITHKKFMVEIFRLCLRLTDSRDNSQSIIRLSKKVPPFFCLFFFSQIGLNGYFTPMCKWLWKWFASFNELLISSSQFKFGWSCCLEFFSTYFKFFFNRFLPILFVLKTLYLTSLFTLVQLQCFCTSWGSFIMATLMLSLTITMFPSVWFILQFLFLIDI